MVFSPRLRQIITILLKEEKSMSIQVLAKHIKVSKRTVQRELEYMDVVLKRFGVNLQSKTGQGIWLEGTKEDKEALLHQLESEAGVPTEDKKERRKRLILEILKDRSPKKLYYYSNIFQVSEATVSNDMDHVETWFSRFDLNLIRKPGYGVYLEGTEKNYRLAMREFVDENIDNGLLESVFSERDYTIIDMIGDDKKGSIFGLLNHDILKQVILCFVSIKDKKISQLTENSYMGLVLHVTIAIDRILKDEIIEPNRELLEKIHKDEDYELAKHIINSLEEQFQIEIPDVEIAYIYLHIKGSKIQTVDSEDFGLGETEKKEALLQIIYEMIDAYDPIIAYELRQDEDFIIGLLAHLQPTFVRLRNGMAISNPLLDQIKADYADEYSKCENVAKVLEQKLGQPLPEPEIGYLTIHFGAAQVRLKSKKENIRKISIGIVCASGIGISRLMLTKLKDFLKDRAELTTYGKEDVTLLEIKRNDFFISSISLDDVAADILMVSPLLVDDDLDRINKKVKDYARTLKDEYVVATDFSDQLEMINYISVIIKMLLDEFHCIYVDSTVTFDELVKIITSDLSEGERQQMLIQKDITAREKVGTQMIPEYGFALLHTRSKGVSHPAFAICLPKEAKEFTDSKLKKIRAVIVLLMPDDQYAKENREVLGYISGSLVDSSQFLDLIFAGHEEPIKNHLTKVLRQYFNQCLKKMN